MKREELIKIADEYNTSSEKSVFESLDRQCEEAARNGHYYANVVIHTARIDLDRLSLEKLISTFAEDRDLTFTHDHDGRWKLSWEKK